MGFQRRTDRTDVNYMLQPLDGGLTMIDEEVALIAYRERRIPLVRIREKWHKLEAPDIDTIRNSAAKLATIDNPLVRLQNDVIEWIGDLPFN